MIKNDLGQSDCRIFESTISQVRIDESAWLLACRYRFKKQKMVCKFLVAYGQIAFSQSNLWFWV